MATSSEIIAKTVQLGANNYHSREVVIEHALGAKVYDPEGRAYYDMLSAYSALNFGHLHPEIVAAAMEQLQKVTLTSRAFHNAVLGDFYERLCDLTGKAMILPMNTGAEAVETALKTARRWGVEVKGVANEQQEIIVCANIRISNSLIICHWAIAKNSQNLCRFIVFPLNTLFLILCTTITRGGRILVNSGSRDRSIGARSLRKRRNRSSRHHGNCHAHCQGGADHSFQSHKNPPFMNYSQNITMPAQSKKSAAPAKWLVQRSAFCTLGIYRPLR